MSTSLNGDPEWKFLQAFVNGVLRKGMEREAERMQESMEARRRYRYKVQKRLMIKSVYKEIAEATRSTRTGK